MGLLGEMITGTDNGPGIIYGIVAANSGEWGENEEE